MWKNKKKNSVQASKWSFDEKQLLKAIIQATRREKQDTNSITSLTSFEKLEAPFPPIFQTVRFHWIFKLFRWRTIEFEKPEERNFTKSGIDWNKRRRKNRIWILFVSPILDFNSAKILLIPLKSYGLHAIMLENFKYYISYESV